MSERRYVFLTGCARSGTSAFSRLLNNHPDLVVGMERFKSFVKKERIADFGPHLFAEERFFDFQPTDTNQTPEKNNSLRLHYSLAREKYGSALVVGDKVPALTNYFAALDVKFPDSAVVVIVRDVASVAGSWKRLGLESNSKFFAGKKAWHGVVSWNKSLDRIAAALESKKPPFIVSYEQLFSGSYNFEKLLGFIGVPVRDEFLEVYQGMMKKSTVVASRESLLDDADHAYIEEKANMPLYQQVIAHAA